MGLDLLVKDRQGHEAYGEKIASYSGFHAFRVSWAKLLGFDLSRMEGYEGTEPWDGKPLKSFFDHSDCDGNIPWPHARAILRQAREDAPKLPEFEWEFRVLIAACEAAIKHRTPIIFC